jgi:hypothetical protein
MRHGGQILLDFFFGQVLETSKLFRLSRHSAAMIRPLILAVALFCCGAWASFSLPHAVPQTAPSANSSKADQGQSDKFADLIAAIKALQAEVATQGQANANHNPPDGPPIWSNWALAVFAAVAAGVALRTLKAIKREIEETTKSTLRN